MLRAFFAMVWCPGNAVAASSAARLQNELIRAPWDQIPRHEEDGFVLTDLSPPPWTGPVRSLLAPESQPRGSALFGQIFNSETPGKTPKDSDTADWLSTRGSALLADWWGQYVCFLRFRNSWSVVTEPAASIPCYYCNFDGLTLVFSHLERCGFLDRKRFTLNRDYLSRLLIYDRLPGPETALNQVQELPGGCRLDITPFGHRIERLWDPRSIARRGLDVPLPEACGRLSDTVRQVVSAQSTSRRRIIMSLSGGLDSSIVLGCLATQGKQTDLVAVHHRLGSEDLSEARFARAAAEKAGCRYSEIVVSHEQTLPAPETHPLSVRPFRQFLQPDIAALFRGAVELEGASIFTGQGGDHLFLTSRSPHGFIDRLQNKGIGPEAVRELFNAARLSGKSVFSILLSCMAGEPGTNSMLAALELKLAAAGGDPERAADWLPDWATQTGHLPPGKADHVSRLVHLYQLREPLQRSADADIVHPLLSQPLLELSLRLPVYQLCAHGITRGLARLAFRDVLPDPIRTRLTKGYASGYFSQQIEANLPVIKDALLGGALVQTGLLAPQMIEPVLKSGQHRIDSSGKRLLILYTIESWLRSWQAAWASSQRSPA